MAEYASTVDQLPAVDLQSQEYLGNPYAVLGDLRARSPLAKSRRGIEVLSYRWNFELFPDRRFETPNVNDFIAKGAPPVFQAFLGDGFLLGIHGERHDQIRRVVQKGFTIRRINDQRAVMQRIAGEILEEFIDASRVDFVRQFTAEFPVRTLCHLLGVPSHDIQYFRDAAITLHLMGAVPIAPGFPKIEAGLKTLHDYVIKLVAARRQAPQDDYISDLIAAEKTEGQLTETELVWNIANLLFAGQDTTRYQLASVVRSLVCEPGNHWEQLANNTALIPLAIREGMRFYPAAQWNSRRALEDVEFRGFRFNKGQWVFLNNIAASRDPEAFSNPHVFDIGRSERFDIPFGRGLHHCLGQILARTGMEEALKVLTQGITKVEMAEIELAKSNSMIGGPEKLILTFQAR